MALPRGPDVADLGIDLADEFAHLDHVTKPAGRMGEALGVVIDRFSDRRLDFSRTIPGTQRLAVKPSAARGRVAEGRHHEGGSWLAGQPFRAVQLTQSRQGLVN